MERILQFTEEAKHDDKQAVMLLTKPIGMNPENPLAPHIDGTAFAEEMNWLKAQGKEITVKINSIGGNVVQGWTILDAVESCGANTHVIGLAASMAGVIYLGGKKKTCEPYACVMLHAPHGGSEAYRKIVSASFKEILTNRTKLTADAIEKILQDGDHFFDASDMVNKGLCDEAPKSRTRVFKRPENANASELFEIYNSFITEDQKQKTTTMELKDFLSFFSPGKSETEAIASMASMKSENERLKAEATAKETELASMKAQLAENAKQVTLQNATLLIEQAVADKKLVGISAEDKVKLIENATGNYDVVKMMIDGMTAPAAAPKKSASVQATVIDSKQSSDTLTYEYLAVHEPKKLEQIAENEPELFNKLVAAYQESQKK
jgi:ATP-dependent protease ClpP protease subunit